MKKRITISCMALLLAMMALGKNQVHAQVTAGNPLEEQTTVLQNDDATDNTQENQTTIAVEDGQVQDTDENSDLTLNENGQNPQDENPENGETNDGEEVISPFDQDMENWESADISNTYVRRAKNTQYQLSLKKVPTQTTNYTVTWKSSNKKVATVDNFGNVSMVKVGSVFITATVKTESGYETRYSCEVEVTNPKFSQKQYVLAKGTTFDLDILGSDSQNFKMSSSDDTLLKAYKTQPGMVRGKVTGTATVTAQIDGATITCQVVVTNPKVKKKLFVMEKNKIDSILVTELSDLSKVSYTSKNPKIATVSSKGKITTYKTGVAVIIVTVDHKEFEITVSVGRPKAVQAIKNAQKVLGATYSQAYRMRKGYYDCSSLVWRSYMPTGLTFGYSKYASNAPTAAGECYYLDTHKKAVASSYVDEKQLKPGDVVFISSGYNGRYKNITHVVIYIGNDIIIHATPSGNNCVQYGSYSKYQNMIVGIGRPTA